MLWKETLGEFVNEGACSETADMALQWGGTAETEKCEETGILLLPPLCSSVICPTHTWEPDFGQSSMKQASNGLTRLCGA